MFVCFYFFCLLYQEVIKLHLLKYIFLTVMNYLFKSFVLWLGEFLASFCQIQLTKRMESVKWSLLMLRTMLREFC